ncbi:MAG: T9SS type A sorting domain-containing protein [Sphingobacteriaceae bacterium]|nr:T9SS type A sorting domain-containing protein [Sphingobacteriaceae bacterium]
MKRIFSTGKFQKFLFLTSLTIISGFLELEAQTSLPKYTSYTAPSPSPGAPGESFNPTMSGTAAANTPLCGEWTRTAGRDESMVITGVDFTRFGGSDEGKDTRFTVYGTSGFQKDASIQRLESNKAIITLDKSIPAWSMFLIWPGNGAGYGAPIAVNKTDAWWVGPAKAMRGSTVAVYGRNLAQYNDSTTSHIYIKPASGAGQWATVTKVNPYKVDFTVPANLANGEYEVWAHNGHGGEYGWSGPLKLTINDGAQWSQVEFNVKDYGALGNGEADDTDAILRTLAAARNSQGSTVYFPEGSYMISNMLFPGNYTKWRGAGTGKTFIKCRSNFNSTDAMIFGSVNTFQISDLTFDTNNNYRGGHAEPIFLRGSSNIKITNVVFSCANYNVLQLDNTNEVFITNCKSIGRISFLGKCSQLFIDNCKFYLTNDTELALHSWGGLGISMTNSTCQDYNNSDPNNGAGWGKGRFFVATGNSGSGRYTYLGNNSTYDLTVRESSTVDQNSGEQFLWEGFSAVWSGSAISSSGATTTLSGFAESLEKPKVAVITKGRGLGQSRRLVAASGSTVTLESAWNIQPDASSTICVGHFVDRVVMYRNYIDGKAYAVSSPNPSASAGIEPYGGVLNFIADRNTVSEVRAGIANWSTQHGTGVDPNYFSLFTNNKIVNCRWGIQNGLDMYRPAETALLGAMYRNNTISTTLQSGVVNTITQTATPVLESFVYEHNDFSNVRAAFSAGGDLGLPMHFPGSNPEGMSGQMFYKNNFSSSGGEGAIIVTPKVTLRDNTFTGFVAPYTGTLPEPVVKSPLHVIEISGVAVSSATAPFTIWNSGITAIDWKASSSNSWLKLSDTAGVIKDERGSSDITLNANAADLTAGTYTSTISVSVGSVLKKYTVLYKVLASSGPKVVIASPTADNTFTAPAAVNITAEASDTDGTVSKVEFFEGSNKIGEDLSSPFSISWNNMVAGTYSITAKATDNAGLTATSSPVSITVKPVATPLAPTVVITSSSINGLVAPAITTITAEASDADGTITKVEFFSGDLKLGEDLVSPYTFTWNEILAGAYVVTAKATDNSGLSTTSAALNITVSTPVLPIAPSVSLRTALSDALTAEGSVTLIAEAADTDGSISKVEFFEGTTKLGESTSSPYNFSWNNIPAGTYSLTAKAIDNSGLVSTSAAITIQVNAPLALRAATVVMTLPAPNSIFTAPGSATLSADVSDAGRTITKVEFFTGSTKIGEDLTTPYYFTWHNIPAGNYAIVAKATDNLGLITLSAPVNIQVNAPVIAVAPVISITSPSSNSILTAPGSATLSADASDSDGTISKVEFFAGTTKLGEDNTSPYSYVYSNIPAGTYSITAKAIDNSGLATVSAPIGIQVNAPVVLAAPTVNMTLPIANASFVAPASATLSAVANDTDGTIVKVEFFTGTTKIGEDLAAPYYFTWHNISAGSYSITAKATDNSGLTSISSPITIQVNAPVVAVAPSVNMVLPAQNASFTAPASATLSAEASDNDGNISKVEFFAGTTKVGEDLTAPYYFTWHNIAAGNYSITAKATDNSGLTTISAPVNIYVNAPVVLKAPIVSMTLPAPNSVYTAPGSATLSAEASDSDGTIAKVEFFAGSKKIGEDLTAPYYFTWHNIPDGNYAITAKATDNSGLSTISEPLNITVNVPLIASATYTLTAYPNPFQEYITIDFTSIEKTQATLQIFNFQGILLETLFKGRVEAGQTVNCRFNGSNLPNGTYISRLTCGGTTIAKQIVLMR